ncbi:MAG: CDP-alcohol phosphatidyltransferase family protein [Endomicrobia bacterium]|nr:CDP-alcohol phosphatidyltransferase family protein [Endomicrobiia bacterium]MCX7941074.1 CDP-alcohol phosphatidyltransferase family protein [Endomicrobiia bacterium]MDW8055376.1 CDP-alcohol phosphatidyltransferase family protein [Elusimicrobiota bacterium]
MHIITIPNLLSILRICFTVLFIVTFLNKKLGISILSLTICIMTDFLDGFFARVLKQRTKFGSFLDPLADKTFVISVIIVLMFRNYIPWWFFGIIIIREALVIAGWIITYQHTANLDTKPRFLGKVSIGLEMITILSVIINTYTQWEIINEIIHELFFLTSVFAIGSLIDYISHARKLYQR